MGKKKEKMYCLAACCGAAGYLLGRQHASNSSVHPTVAPSYNPSHNPQPPMGAHQGGYATGYGAQPPPGYNSGGGNPGYGAYSHPQQPVPMPPHVNAPYNSHPANQFQPPQDQNRQYGAYPTDPASYGQQSADPGYPVGPPVAHPTSSTGAPYADAVGTPQPIYDLSASRDPSSPCENCGLVVVDRLKQRHLALCAAKHMAASPTQPTKPAPPAVVNESGAVIAKKEEAEGEEKECCICISQEKTHAFVPCGHLSVCADCADGLAQCPLCRQPATAKIRVYQ